MFVLEGRNGSTPLVTGGSVSLSSALRDAQMLSDQPIEKSFGLIVSDLNSAGYEQAVKAKTLNKVTVLIRNEPVVVCPMNFDVSKMSIFDYIIDVGRKGFGAHYVSAWPQNWPAALGNSLDSPSQRLERAVLVNANKLSFIKGELYSLRRVAIDKGLVDVIGFDWDSTFISRLRTLLGELLIAITAHKLFSPKAIKGWFKSHPNYRGTAEDKLTALSSYKVAVVIENSGDYMSEKLMDALFAGCIPVYVGPKVEDWNIPRQLVITTAPSFEGVRLGIKIALDVNYESWRKEVFDFLSSAGTKEFWEAPSVFQRITVQLANIVDSSGIQRP